MRDLTLSLRKQLILNTVRRDVRAGARLCARFRGPPPAFVCGVAPASAAALANAATASWRRVAALPLRRPWMFAAAAGRAWTCA